MRPAMFSGIVIGDALVSYWSFFSMSLIIVPEAFAKVNSPQFPPLFLIGEYRVRSHLLTSRATIVALANIQRILVSI